MSKRRRYLLHGLTTFAAIAACTRGTDLFRFFVRPKEGLFRRTRVAQKRFDKFEWDLLARAYEETQRHRTSQYQRLSRPHAANQNGQAKTGGGPETDGIPPSGG